MRFLFAVTDFNMGGITSSLKHLSDELIRRGHSVDMINLANIPRLDLPFHCSVNIIPLKGKSKHWGIDILDFHRATGLRKVILLAVGAIKKILNRFGQWERFIFSGMPVYKNYDVAIAYRQSSICYFLIQNKVLSQKKIAFIHSEFDGNCSSWLPFLYNMDLIACPSNDWSQFFGVTFPELQSKVRTVYNIFDPVELKRKSEEFLPEFKKQTFSIVTVARIEFSQKQLDWIPLICHILREKNQNFVWYIVGDGPDKDKLNQLIQRANVSDFVKLLGAKANPYPFIKYADLFVLASKWESYGMVIQEALILGTPVVAADYPALHEIMNDGEQGIITENSLEGVTNAVQKMMTDRETYYNIKEKCRIFRYSVDLTYNQFIEICQ